MASVNKVFLMGNLTRDPEIRYLPSGVAVAGFGIATNRKYKVGDELKEEVCFVDINVFGKQADACSTYLHKGSGVFIEGTLRFRSWETDDGQKRSKLDVNALNVQFLSGRSGSDFQPKSENGNGGKGSDSPPSDVVEDDIPF